MSGSDEKVKVEEILPRRMKINVALVVKTEVQHLKTIYELIEAIPNTWIPYRKPSLRRFDIQEVGPVSEADQILNP